MDSADGSSMMNSPGTISQSTTSRRRIMRTIQAASPRISSVPVTTSMAGLFGAPLIQATSPFQLNISSTLRMFWPSTGRLALKAFSRSSSVAVRSVITPVSGLVSVITSSPNSRPAPRIQNRLGYSIMKRPSGTKIAIEMIASAARLRSIRRRSARPHRWKNIASATPSTTTTGTMRTAW